ncbi:hypothetical protein GCM10009037_19820 [Halarchaeum grantii]|uniref:DUF7718 domain-containing protein n=2 Tax=Halarchaeum grantii TaxID=1193105 RepID=A0A830FAZ3_9EURY|nr:hypothetical protein GCM10009037_19820 [Halarchaeum grantii]
MTQSDFYYDYQIDTTFPDPLFLGVRLDPSANDPQSWAVVLGFGQADGTLTEIAKVDNSPHEAGDIHVDRYYREDSAEQKDFDIDISTYYEAEEYLRENATRYAALFLENHPDDVETTETPDR